MRITRGPASNHAPRILGLRRPPAARRSPIPRAVRIAGRGFFVTSMLNSLRGRIPGMGRWFLDQVSKGLGFIQADHILQGVVICWSLRHALSDRGTWPIEWQGERRPDGFVRESFSLPREQARAKAKAFLKSYPSGRLHERGGAVARTSGWLDRIYYAPAADRGLDGDNGSRKRRDVRTNWRVRFRA